MTLLRRAVFMAAKRAASDPHIQARARRVTEEEIVPRVRGAAERLRPAIDEARHRAQRAADGLRDAAAEHSPTDDPAGFLKAAGRHLGKSR